MFVSPISFTGYEKPKGPIKHLSGQGETRHERYKDLWQELQSTYIVRNVGVNAPYYCGLTTEEKNSDELEVKYELQGEPANAESNPIMPEHFDNLLNNFYQMEKIGFFHRLLSDDNVLFGEKGKVQILAMKNIVKFVGSSGKLIQMNDNAPDFMMTSNAEAYEDKSLCTYISNLSSSDCREFIKAYLKEKSGYHKARAEFLQNKKGFIPESKVVRIEELRAKAFANPSDEVVDFEDRRFDILDLKRQAAAMWNEGNGANGHQLSPKKRFVSAVALLEALKRVEDLRDRVEKYSKTAEDADMREYFAFEKEYLDVLGENVFEAARSSGDVNFCSPKYGGIGLFLGSKDDREIFNNRMEKIKSSDSHEERMRHINFIYEFYVDILRRWTPNKNKQYKMEYAEQTAHAFA